MRFATNVAFGSVVAILLTCAACGQVSPSPTTSTALATLSPTSFPSPQPLSTGYVVSAAPGLRKGVYRNRRYGFSLRLGKGWLVMEAPANGVRSRARLVPLHFYDFVTTSPAPFPPDCSGGMVVCRLPAVFADRASILGKLRTDRREVGRLLWMEGAALFPSQGFHPVTVSTRIQAGSPLLEATLRASYSGAGPQVLVAVMIGPRYVYYLKFFGFGHKAIHYGVFRRIVASLVAQ